MEPIKLTVQIYDIKVKRDGGARIQLDCGNDSIEGVQALLGVLASGDLNLAAVLVPYSERSSLPDMDQE